MRAIVGWECTVLTILSKFPPLDRSPDVTALVASDDRGAAGRGSHKPKSHEGSCRLPSGVEHMTRYGREKHNGMVSRRVRIEVIEVIQVIEAARVRPSARIPSRQASKQAQGRVKVQ